MNIAVYKQYGEGVDRMIAYGTGEDAKVTLLPPEPTTCQPDLMSVRESENPVWFENKAHMVFDRWIIEAQIPLIIAEAEARIAEAKNW